MLVVIRALYTLHQHIIDVCLHGALDQILKDFVNHSLERGPDVLESKGHHLVAIDFLIGYEGSFFFIWWVYLDLIVARISVHEGKELMASRRLY